MSERPTKESFYIGVSHIQDVLLPRRPGQPLNNLFVRTTPHYRAKLDNSATLRKLDKLRRVATQAQADELEWAFRGWAAALEHVVAGASPPEAAAEDVAVVERVAAPDPAVFREKATRRQTLRLLEALRVMLQARRTYSPCALIGWRALQPALPPALRKAHPRVRPPCECRVLSAPSPGCPTALCRRTSRVPSWRRPSKSGAKMPPLSRPRLSKWTWRTVGGQNHPGRNHPRRVATAVVAAAVGAVGSWVDHQKTGAAHTLDPPRGADRTYLQSFPFHPTWVCSRRRCVVAF